MGSYGGPETLVRLEARRFAPNPPPTLRQRAAYPTNFVQAGPLSSAIPVPLLGAAFP